MELKIKRLAVDAIIPKYQTPFAAAMDVCVDISSYEIIECYDAYNIKGVLNVNSNGTIIVPPFTTAIIHTGIAIEPPEGYKVDLRPRSGKSIKEGLMFSNAIGLIDNDYRGELLIGAYNSKRCDLIIRHHERIGQIEVVPYVQVKVIEVDELSDTLRGDGGLGSTGK